jgi:hypothetical protein
VIQVASERSIEPSLTPESFAGPTRPTNGRAVLHFATQSLLSWNDLVWHHLVCGVTRVLDCVSELLYTGVSLTWSANSRTRYKSRPSPPLPSTLPSSTPGVSILRPLKGLDTNLFDNLESSFKQDYPNFEILLSVADEHDEALSVARELISQYPNVNAKVIIGVLSPLVMWTS